MNKKNLMIVLLFIGLNFMIPLIFAIVSSRVMFTVSDIFVDKLNDIESSIEEQEIEEPEIEEDVSYDEDKVLSNIDVDGYLVYLTSDEYNNKILNKETFFIVVVQQNCSHCHVFLPIMTEVVKEYFLENVYAIELANYRASNYYYEISGTPTTLFIENGVDKGSSYRIVGSKSKLNVVQYFKDNGRIK